MDSLSCSWIVTLCVSLSCSSSRSRRASLHVSWDLRRLAEVVLGDSPSNHGARAIPAGEGSADETGCTKSGIRTPVIFRLILVTDEFYARVTARRVTRRGTGDQTIRDKRPACRWLRSSRNNCADQSTIVIESLPMNSPPAAPRRTGQPSTCSVFQSTSVHQNGVGKFAGKTLLVSKYYRATQSHCPN
ncbi:hypothetical protein BayCH28_08935 [Mycolicibacterium sp. CH28]|nr:hypothetical protein BayCH28_08935 [Mycolicibacterium sp. CH28]